MMWYWLGATGWLIGGIAIGIAIGRWSIPLRGPDLSRLGRADGRHDIEHIDVEDE